MSTAIRNSTQALSQAQEPLLLKLDRWEAAIVDVAVKIVVWLMPFFTAILLTLALQAALGLALWAAIVGAAVIELMGLAAMHTMMGYFYEWKGEQPAKVNFLLTAGCVLGYIASAFTIALFIKLPPEVTIQDVSLSEVGKMLVPPLAVILSMLSALIGSIRASTYKSRVLGVGQKQIIRKPTSRPSGGPVRKRPDLRQTNDESLANLEQANEVRQPAQADYDLAYQLKYVEGLTWPQVAEQLGRSESTAKRWAGQGRNGVN